MSSKKCNIRMASDADAAIVHDFVCALADDHDERSKVASTVADIHAALRADPPHIEALLAFQGETPVGMALFFPIYSTYAGKRALYLEDFVVDASCRGNGIGRQLLERLAAVARERDCCKIEWVAADWNTRGHKFYEKAGADRVEGVVGYRLSYDAMAALDQG